MVSILLFLSGSKQVVERTTPSPMEKTKTPGKN